MTDCGYSRDEGPWNVVGSSLPHPEEGEVGFGSPKELTVKDKTSKARAARRVTTSKEELSTELVGTFGDVMVSEGAELLAEAIAFNARLDAWFERYPDETLESVATLITRAICDRNAGADEKGVFAMVFRDLLRVSGITGKTEDDG